MGLDKRWFSGEKKNRFGFGVWWDGLEMSYDDTLYDRYIFGMEIDTLEFFLGRGDETELGWVELR